MKSFVVNDMGLSGLEPPTSRLSGVRSNQAELQAHYNKVYNGAGEGNRTLDISLEGWSFTTKLHPQILATRLIITHVF